MRKVIASLLLCVLFISSQAQEKDSVKVSKNEIGINLVPVIASLGGSLGHNINNKLQYKRRINSKLWYKASLSWVTNRNPLQQLSPDYKIVSETDTTRSVTYSTYNNNNELNISQGIEYRFGKKRIKQFTGADLGYAHSSSYGTEKYGVYKKTYYSTANTDGGYFAWKDNILDSTITSTSAKNNSIVLTPFYGARINITNRLLFSMQLGVQLKYGFSKVTYSTDNAQQYPESQNIQSFDFTTSGLLNDFSLVYRF